MPPSVIVQRRTHNLLLFQKLLNLRDGASPFTLLLDTLEQSAQSVVREFMRRAKVGNAMASKTKIVFVSFQTIRKPRDADIFIKAYKMPLAVLRLEMAGQIPPSAPVTVPGSAPSAKTLVIIDTLNLLAATSASHLPTFLASLLGPAISVLATYHTDIPLPSSFSETSCLGPPSTTRANHNPYAPDPLTTLMYLATSVLRISSFSHAIEKKRARDRSLAEPDFGLGEGRDGILIGLKNVQTGGGEVVIDMEMRRKSGRGVREEFVLDTSSSNSSATAMSARSSATLEKAAGAPAVRTSVLGAGGKICLLEDHPLYAPPSMGDVNSACGNTAGAGGAGDGQVPETTFSLGLTEKQRKDREGVVLPYFDAQRGDGSGEGGRILYEMDRADDFDEEEDEI